MPNSPGNSRIRIAAVIVLLIIIIAAIVTTFSIRSQNRKIQAATDAARTQEASQKSTQEMLTLIPFRTQMAQTEQVVDEMEKASQQICTGKPVQETAPYNPGPGIHPILLYTTSAESYPFPETIRPKTIRELELVGCIKVSTEKDEKEYGLFGLSGGYFCTEIKTITTISLREAHTAKIIFEKQLVGSGGCDASEEFGQNQHRMTKYVEPVSPEMVWDTIRDFVIINSPD
jgi:type II secretory pathway pseudopilin PulG